MNFTWIDYPGNYKEELDSWCDDTVRLAIDDENISEEHDWYAEGSGYVHNKNYFCKIILENMTVIGVLFLTVHKDINETYLDENIVLVDTLIVNPAMRNRGYAVKIIKEFINHVDVIIPFDKNIYIAQVHKDNEISKKLFNRLGFRFICVAGEADDDWFDWVYPADKAAGYVQWREKIGWPKDIGWHVK